MEPGTGRMMGSRTAYSMELPMATTTARWLVRPRVIEKV